MCCFAKLRINLCGVDLVLNTAELSGISYVINYFQSVYRGSYQIRSIIIMFLLI